MRILFDALPARFGGIATQVISLSRAWQDVAPNDHAKWIVSTQFAAEVAFPADAVYPVDVSSPRGLWQPIAQTKAVLTLAKCDRPDVIMAMVPQVSLFAPGIPEVVFVHDMRHHARPDQFTQVQLFQRWIAYRRAYARATALVVPSVRTRDDIIRWLPHLSSKPIFVVPHGCDHVMAKDRPPDRDVAIGFGHTKNKNPRLLVDAWSRLHRQAQNIPTLTITGCTPSTASDLERHAETLGIKHIVRVMPFLSPDAFSRLQDRAALILFPSDYEGFGLPVLEAMRQSIPIVITPESALLEVAGGHATVAEDASPQALADAASLALTCTSESVVCAQRYSNSYTWARSARELRAVLREVALGRRGPRH